MLETEHAHKHTHTPTPQPGVAGAHAERAHKHTPTPTPQPGLARRSRNPNASTHTHTAHPSQDWRAGNRARTQTHTYPNTPARSGGAQPKPEPKHTHPHRTHQPGVAGYKRSAHTNTHTPQHPSQEWRGAAATRAQAHKSTPHTPARSGRVQRERAHKYTHTPTPQPGAAGRSRSPSPSTPTQDHSQDWRGYCETQTQTHAPHNYTPHAHLVPSFILKNVDLHDFTKYLCNPKQAVCLIVALGLSRAKYRHHLSFASVKQQAYFNATGVRVPNLFPGRRTVEDTWKSLTSLCALE